MSNNPMQLHETVIRDIVDVISGISSETEPLKGIFSGTSYRSVAKGASNLTLVFPVIAEESVSVDAARMTCKAIERTAVTMLQMLFSAICITDAKNAIDYVKQIHNNIDLDDGLDVNEFIGIMDKVSTSEATGIEITDPTMFKQVMEDMRNIDFHLDESFNSPLDRFTINPAVDPMVVREDYNDDDKTFSAGVGFAKDQQIATDVRKANELVPTLITIKFYVNDESGMAHPTTAIVGIKAKLQYVSKDDMINRIVLKNKDKNGLFNFLRASTREISFWKDFIFAIDRAKIDALSTSGKGSSNRVWKLLERRAIKSRVKRFTGMMNDASSITSLIISKETADTLTKEYRINVFRSNTILPIMETYNLMGFAVVDEVLEKVNFLFDDGSGEYEVVSFAHLEREESGNYKKIINLLAKSR